MPIDRISILDVIKGGDIHASLFTTFNANLKFYEDFVLRKLTVVGSYNNVLVMDRNQFDFACSSEATRPNLAGFGYTLIPVSVPAHFIQKFACSLERNDPVCSIGSHNLTISGFGYNREVSTLLQISAAPGSPELNLVASVWSMVRQWLDQTDLPPALLESAYRLDRVFGETIPDSPFNDVVPLAQHVGSTGLLNQLIELAPRQVRETRYA